MRALKKRKRGLRPLVWQVGLRPPAHLEIRVEVEGQIHTVAKDMGTALQEEDMGHEEALGVEWFAWLLSNCHRS